MTYGLNVLYQNLGSPRHYKQEVSSTSRRLETAFLYFNIPFIIYSQ